MRLLNTRASTNTTRVGKAKASRPAASGNTWLPVTKVQVGLNNQLNWLLQSKSQSLDSEPVFVFDSFRQLAHTTTALYPTSPHRRLMRLSPLSAAAAASSPLIPQLRTEFRRHKHLFTEVAIHGSVATNEVVSHWSDLDLVAILKQDTLANTELFMKARACLRRAEQLVYKFDPWQHHGIQIMTEADIRFYPEFFLPLAVWRKAGSLLATTPRRLTFKVRDSHEESAGRLWGIVQLFQTSQRLGELRHHGRAGVYLKDDFKNATETFYQFKYFVSVVLLLPSLFLELVEGPVFKKESFTRIATYLTDEELELIRACEQVRLLAPTLSRNHGAIPAAMQQALGPHYFSRAARLARRLWQLYATS